MKQLLVIGPATVLLPASRATLPAPGVLASIPGCFGRTDITGFRDNENRNGWVRLEKYTSHADGKEIDQYCFCASETDLTPIQQNKRDYDSQCSCCYLNIPHTIGLHELRLSL